MVAIVNITRPPTAVGENLYELRINHNPLVQFTHNREERLSVLLRKAADAYDTKHHGMVKFGTGQEKSFEEGMNVFLEALFPK